MVEIVREKLHLPGEAEVAFFLPIVELNNQSTTYYRCPHRNLNVVDFLKRLDSFVVGEEFRGEIKVSCRDCRKF